VETQLKAYETGMQQFITHLKNELENDQPTGLNRHLAEMKESPLQQCDIERSQALTQIDDDFECLICKYVV
jgi:SOS-response transcriptional repressor LexA